MKTIITLALLAEFALSRLLADEPADFLPPAPPWHGASEALIARPDNPWITPAERMNLLDSPSYDETIAYLKKLCAASPLLELQPFGQTAQGRTLFLAVATREKAFTPAALRAGGKPTLLAQAGIHSGEIDGKDAGLMLLRDLAFGGKAALLDRANFLFIPVLNADGHERSSAWNRPNQRGPVHQGWRTTAQNLNLNRDYMKADSPEIRALIGVINAWSPSLYFDLHVTDGMDYQYDITYGYHGFDGDGAWSPKSAAWLDRVFHPAVDTALKAQGHLPLNICIEPVDDNDLSKGLNVSRFSPRFSHAYADLRHLPAILVENHSLKSYRQRVLGTYVLLESTLALLGREGAALQAAIAADQASRPATLPVTWAGGGEHARELDFLGIDFERYDSPASGAKEVRWLGRPKTFSKLPLVGNQPGILIKRPTAYWVPVTKPDVIDRLRLHGVRVEPLTAAKTLSVSMYRLVDPKPLPIERTHPFEARFTLKFGVTTETRTETFPAGSVRVPTDQSLGDLAMALLEPQGADSFASWGFFNEILKRTEYIEGHVIAPMAEKMLADNPKLKAEFEAKVAADDKFAKNPAARLQWFYQRSRFYDERYLLYPIGIERGD
jgi:murein tripeptide amidase MpaA